MKILEKSQFFQGLLRYLQQMTEIKTLSKGLKALQIISESEVGIGTTELSKHLDMTNQAL